ncbi:MAG: prepilin-type N-terminal cleavage/methylation domain-containing protein [Armatimonadetes bacterium]|nr:prepilin-type N-terminal cleavage/methylation domain-containing protein [Armatimonadota bacterium]
MRRVGYMRCYRRRRGFTLIECLVTTVVLGIGVIGVAGMFACATLSERKASNMAQARHVAEETLEVVRAGEYAIFDHSEGTVSIPTPGLPRATGTLAWEPYSSGNDDLKVVALNLNWDWAGSSSGTYRVVTLVSKQGGI